MELARTQPRKDALIDMYTHQHTRFNVYSHTHTHGAVDYSSIQTMFAQMLLILVCKAREQLLVDWNDGCIDTIGLEYTYPNADVVRACCLGFVKKPQIW